MPYPVAHGLLTILGDAYTQSEEWQTGLRLLASGPPTEAEFVAVDAAIATFLGNSALRFPSGRRYLGLKWAPQDTSGRYPEGEDSIEWFRTTPLSGGGPVGFPQIAVVTSLRTPRTRGFASNGRMYWPATPSVSATDGRMSAPDALSIATAGAALIGAIADSGIGTPAVFSAVGAGRAEPVTGVRVGRVADTVRRRRNQIAEEYTDVVAVPS